MNNRNFQNILAINASAGSGKTYQLTLRYLTLLFLGAHPSKILAVTFTKKAAKEMKERIAQTLMKLQSGEIAAGDPLWLSIKEVYSGNIKERSKSLLELYLSSNNKISTIDSFVHQILRKFCFYASVRHDFELFSLDEKELKSRFFELLDEGQKERLADYLEGKGDTPQKLFSLFASLYEEESDLWRIKKMVEGYERAEFFAARAGFLELANRFYEYLCEAKPAKFTPKVFDSVHGFLKTNSFEKLITERAALSAHRDYKALSNERSEALFASLKSSLAAYYEAGAKDTLFFLLNEFEWYKKARDGIAKEKNALGFDDIAKIVKELLEDGRIDSDFLYFRLDGEIEHILIDEFQDTSILQFRIIRPLLDEILSGIGTGRFKSFFLVGDPKQSIYRFRGAAAGMFENALDYIKKRAENRYNEAFLDTNYRSAKAPVAFVNELFAPLYTDTFKPQKSASDEEGFVETLKVDEDAVASAVVEKVGEYISLGALPDSITVLCYTNDDIEEIAYLLEEKGIKTQKEGSTSLADDDNVRAVMKLIEYLLLRSQGYSGELAKLAFLSATEVAASKFEEFVSSIGVDTPPAKVVFWTVDNFSLANQNTVKLIEIAALFDDMHSFFTSGKVAEAKKISARQSGVSIMSVHKSKGLEFDYCIVCDTLKKRDTTRMRPILQIHEDFKLTDLVVTSKSAAALLPKVANAMRDEAILSEKDLQNTNYVAMTRAKKGLCVIAKAGGYSKLSSLRLKEGVVGVKEFFVATKQIEASRESYVPEVLNVSLGRQEDFAREDNFAPDDYSAINFGLALHSYIELSNGLEASPYAALYLKNRYGMLLGKSLDSVLKLSESFSSLAIDSAKKPQIYKEISVCIDDNGRSRLYRIDMLLIFDDKAVIVDFKSSHEAKDRYKKQLMVYRDVVRGIVGLKTEAYLALNSGNKLELVEV